MSWLLVTGDLPPGFVGGVASWADDLAAALAAAGEDVTVLARATGGTEGWDRARPYRVARMRGRSWGAWQGAWAALYGAGRLRREARVVFATWPLATALGPLARAAGARVGVAFHGSDLTRLAAPTAGFRRALRAAHALLPVSGFLAGELARLGAPTATVLPMPLPLPTSVPPTRGEALLCVARLTPLKGVERAAALAAAVGRRLVVVGDGPEGARLRGAWPAVDWRGELPRAALDAIYPESAALVLLPRADADGSGAEGLGLVALEAAARGVPAVGCATGGVPEAVGPGVVLRDPDGLPDDDLAAVRGLLADAGAGARARAWVGATHGPARAVSALCAALGGS